MIYFDLILGYFVRPRLRNFIGREDGDSRHVAERRSTHTHTHSECERVCEFKTNKRKRESKILLRVLERNFHLFNLTYCCWVGEVQSVSFLAPTLDFPHLLPISYTFLGLKLILLFTILPPHSLIIISFYLLFSFNSHFK